MKRTIDLSILTHQEDIANTLDGYVTRLFLQNYYSNPTTDMVVLVIVLMDRYYERKKANRNSSLLPIPIQVLSTRFLGLDDYRSNGSVQSVTAQRLNPVIQKLVDKQFIDVHEKDEGVCRKYQTQNLLERYNSFLEKHKHMALVQSHLIDREERRMLNAPKGLGVKIQPPTKDLANPRLNLITRKATTKLRNSRFRFFSESLIEVVDTGIAEGGYYCTDALSKYKLSPEQIKAFYSSLSHMLYKTSEPQYHTEVFLMSTGRLYTRGGPINLQTSLRRKLIGPVDLNNELVEIDLACAQLLILCEVLGATELRETIIQILKEDGSIWGHLGNPAMIKKVKKTIVYTFCFGCDYSRIASTVNDKSFAQSMKLDLKKEDVDELFAGILSPLINLRDEWMSKYTVKNIPELSKQDNTILNALGISFNFRKALEAESVYGKPSSLKIAGQALAHLCQGKEQLIIQSFMVQLPYNIAVYSYDGLTIEVPPSEREQFLSDSQNFLDDNHPGNIWSHEVVYKPTALTHEELMDSILNVQSAA